MYNHVFEYQGTNLTNFTISYQQSRLSHKLLETQSYYRFLDNHHTQTVGTACWLSCSNSGLCGPYMGRPLGANRKHSAAVKLQIERYSNELKKVFIHKRY